MDKGDSRKVLAGSFLRGAEGRAARGTRIGADHVVDHRTTDVADAVRTINNGHVADVVFDPVGGELGTRAAAAVARLGRIAVIGYASGSWLTLDPLDMVLRCATTRPPVSSRAAPSSWPNAAPSGRR
jgi:NADPH:quinone reductase-like Zn-dependent oxidoreductase